MPAGLFLPEVIIGCSMGRILGRIIEYYLDKDVHPSAYAFIGAASVILGYSRLSFLLAVIMLEAIENVNLCLSIIFALFIFIRLEEFSIIHFTTTQ
jgi:H+/Cl- antiporter ClcA